MRAGHWSTTTKAEASATCSRARTRRGLSRSLLCPPRTAGRRAGGARPHQQTDCVRAWSCALDSARADGPCLGEGWDDDPFRVDCPPAIHPSPLRASGEGAVHEFTRDGVSTTALARASVCDEDAASFYAAGETVQKQSGRDARWRARPPGTASTEHGRIAGPTVSLPEGGEVIRRIGEGLSAKPVTGIGSMCVPVPAGPGLPGFRPPHIDGLAATALHALHHAVLDRRPREPGLPLPRAAERSRLHPKELRLEQRPGDRRNRARAARCRPGRSP